jgi:hypothetical protein
MPLVRHSLGRDAAASGVNMCAIGQSYADECQAELGRSLGMNATLKELVLARACAFRLASD